VTRTSYETDSPIPFIAFLGVGLAVALFYALQRARRAQDRGLTLAAMATGIAATIWCIAFALEPMGGLERGDNPEISRFLSTCLSSWRASQWEGVVSRPVG
jgi:hypothetical protein